MLVEFLAAAGILSLASTTNLDTSIVWQPYTYTPYANLPAVEGKDGHKHGGHWFEQTDSDFVSLYGPGSKIGYRVTNDHANVGVMKFLPVNASEPILTATFNGSSQYQPSLQTFGNMGGMQFNLTSNSSSRSGNTWESPTGYRRLPFTYSVDISYACQPDVTVFAHVVDATGKKSDYKGTDSLSLGFDAAPFTVTVWRSDSPTNNTVLSYSNAANVQAKVGSGRVEPTFEQQSLGSTLFWCDQD